MLAQPLIKPWFLAFSTVAIWGGIILAFLPCRMFSSITGLYPLDAGSTPLQLARPKLPPDTIRPPEVGAQNRPWMRTAELS